MSWPNTGGRSAGLPKASRWEVLIVIPLVPFLLALLATVLLLWFLSWFVTRLCLHVAVWCWWNPRGRNVLFVYSDRPLWKSHIETEILPFIQGRAVVLNFSERKRWRRSLARAVFRHFGGQTDFNPLAVVFRPLRPARVFRFWKPFRQWKLGQAEQLRRIEADFLYLVGVKKEHRAT